MIAPPSQLDSGCDIDSHPTRVVESPLDLTKCQENSSAFTRVFANQSRDEAVRPSPNFGADREPSSIPPVLDELTDAA